MCTTSTPGGSLHSFPRFRLCLFPKVLEENFRLKDAASGLQKELDHRKRSDASMQSTDNYCHKCCRYFQDPSHLAWHMEKRHPEEAASTSLHHTTLSEMGLHLRPPAEGHCFGSML